MGDRTLFYLLPPSLLSPLLFAVGLIFVYLNLLIIKKKNDSCCLLPKKKKKNRK